MSGTPKDIARLMKRCQIGVGGRNAIDDAHDIMAECYGTLEKLSAQLADATRERDEARALNAESFCCGGDDACAGGAGCQCHALRAEVERLTACLKRANDQAEEFERKWYLRGDDVERLRSVFSDLIAGLDKTHWSSWQSTAHFYEKYHIARAALQEPTPCRLGCTTECQAREHGCASECPALSWQPKQEPTP